MIVNRVWQYHFGRGIVESSSYFGTQGSAPTHPELLDWLAASFVEHGWSIKWLHRLILASKTYQLTSTADAAREGLDASNVWCWRFQRQRLDAEEIRDAMLFVTGTLDFCVTKVVSVPSGSITWGLFAAPSVHRRRSQPAPQRLPADAAAAARLFLGMFDEPDASSTTDAPPDRPQQALFLMNSDIIRQLSGAFARRLCLASTDSAARTELAHELGLMAAHFRTTAARNYVERY